MSYDVLKAMSLEDLERCLRKVARPVLAELSARGYLVRVTEGATSAPDFAVTPKPTLAAGHR